MLELTVGEIALAVSASQPLPSNTDPAVRVSSSATTDSREITSGGIFFAKRGEKDDGHGFVSDAKRRGAVLAVVERELPVDIPQLVVADTVAALNDLANFVLQRVRGAGVLKVIGITGSNGKTTTKNMLRGILSQFGETVAPRASYNNEVGAPTTILELTSATKFLIAELGAAGLGSIDRLARIVKPDIGVELKVGLAHAGVFGGIENTARIKAELLPHVSRWGVLNADDSAVMAMRTVSGTDHLGWVSFGFSEDAEYQIMDAVVLASGTAFEIRYPDGAEFRVNLRLLGEHQAINAAAALACADLLGLDRERAITALESLEIAERWRMQPVHSNGILFINDAYNASPDSMRAALQTLATIGRAGHRTVAILGEMAELGEFSRAEHDAVGRLVVRYNIDQLYVVGEGARLIHMGALQEGSWDGESQFFATIDEAFAGIRGKLSPGDAVLVKSSNSAELRFLGDKLAEDSR
jgi:UDP-N-acetylmuramoyl-tripeptide--D-alanyl-D-alanine ligase